MTGRFLPPPATNPLTPLNHPGPSLLMKLLYRIRTRYVTSTKCGQKTWSFNKKASSPAVIGAFSLTPMWLHFTTLCLVALRDELWREGKCIVSFKLRPHHIETISGTDRLVPLMIFMWCLHRVTTKNFFTFSHSISLVVNVPSRTSSLLDTAWIGATCPYQVVPKMRGNIPGKSRFFQFKCTSE